MTTLRDPWSDEAVRVRVTLCDAALSLLTDGGIAGFDLRRVDDLAHLPPGTCSGLFHSKGELLAALLEHSAGIYDDKLNEIVEHHPGDLVTCVQDWLSFVVGPARTRSQVIWALLLDPGTRPQVTMYAAALNTRCERRVAESLGLPLDQVRAAWVMVEGWVGRNLIHDLPVPARETLARHIGALMLAQEPDSPRADSATVG